MKDRLKQNKGIKNHNNLYTSSTGQYGIARKFYFPFQKSYWCGVSSTKAEGRAYISNKSDIELGNNGELQRQRVKSDNPN